MDSPSSHPLRRGLVLAVAAGIALPTAATAASPPTPRLTNFPSCTSLKLHAAAKAAPLAASGRYAQYPTIARSMPFAAPVTDAGGTQRQVTPSMTPGLGAGGPEAATPVSGTNLQEAGVDEPDIVLSDPAHVISTVGDEMRIHSATDTPALVGRIRLPSLGPDAQMLRSGDRVMVFSTAYAVPLGMSARRARDRWAIPYAPQTVIRLVDIARPTAPVLLETLRVDGNLLTARRPDGGAVRVVISSSPDPIPYVVAGDGAVRTAAQARRINVRNVRRTPVHTWLPAMRVQARGAKRATARIAVNCRSVARTTQFGGLNTLSVLTIDPARGLTPVDRDAILSDGEIVYGSTTSLYVTTPRWLPYSVDTPAEVPAGATTEIHRFDISRPDVTEYRASGRVTGYVLNQFSLSEHEGVLRVASTRDPEWINVTDTKPSVSFVTTFADDGAGALRQLGRVGGLGTNERIHGVRFIGDRGYVVTFRQVDPLHVIELADPANPRVMGELVIPGYSAYLHPVGDGLLLGVGQDATATGRLRGTQISLFDVSDPAAPRRLQHLTLPDAWSEAENDHHAFLYWPATGLAMIPYATPSGDRISSGAIGVTVSRVAGITRLGDVTHRVAGRPGTTGVIRRSLVIGDRVFTVSDLGVGANRLTDLTPLGFGAYPDNLLPPVPRAEPVIVATP